jgi:hypothetical protein
VTELPEKTKSLLQVLTQQTADGRREWQTGSADTEFVFVHDSGSVIISSVDQDGGYPLALRIVDSTGRIVESYVSATPGEGFQNLYEVARKSSFKASSVTESLLADLTKPDIPF